MGKIKLNLVSGEVHEKDVLTAFKAENESYVVLDNNSTGSMGLPIILVCKLIENKLIKIIDQTEWQKLKEYLKSIIAGNMMEYINVPAELAADTVYFTQLTLPVPSFDAIRNNYKPVGAPAEPVMPSVAPAAPVMPSVAPAAPVMPSVAPAAPVMPSVAPAAPVMPSVEPAAPVMPSVEPAAPVMPSVEPVAPVMPSVETAAPVMPSVEPVAPVMPTTDPVIAPVETVMSNMEMTQPIISTPIIEPSVTPVVESVPNIKPEINYDELKTVFMKSCEEMFDSLVAKFENKE